MLIWRWVQKQFWRFGNFIEGFLVGDNAWGLLRLMVLGFVSLAFMVVCGLLFERDHLVGMLRYLVIPAGAFVAALLWGTCYLQDINEMKRFSRALQYMVSSMFGLSYPYLTIDRGKKQVQVGEENLLDIIGGPGWVNIRPGNVVLFEQLNNPSSVRAEGMHFISRFETIKEIANLEDQHGYIDQIKAVTKDGVVVWARDIHYRYRLWSNRKLGGENIRSTHVPYPYSVQAVRNMTYSRAVRSDGLTAWPAAVRIIFEGEIQNYIRQHTIDQVTAPRTPDADPREDIHRIYRSAAVRASFKNAGTQLLWYGIGNLEPENEKVSQQRVDTWAADWNGKASVVRASGEAALEVAREKARAQAQAEILKGIAKSLGDITAAGADQDRNIKEVFLFRLAQVLETIKDNRRGLPSGEQ
ncbi:MAG TPA: hypothetical protein PKM21_01600 [Anaerolineales bacterium]|nr:hypothetical protein [Anaerolineales bacterium]